MNKREIIQKFRLAVSKGNGDEAGDLVKLHASKLKGAIKVPRKQSSILSRSKQVENKISRELWGLDRVWKERVDVRNDELKQVGEIKSVIPELIWNRGGPFEILKAALKQLDEAIASDPSLSGYFRFACLVPVGVAKLERCIIMLEDETVLSLGDFKKKYVE